MIVVMRQDATRAQVASIEARLRELGFGVQTIIGEKRIVIGATGDKRDIVLGMVNAWEGVERAVPILQPYKFASMEYKQTPSVVRVGGVSIGDGGLVVAAGPCAVEDESQLIEVAHSVKASGADILRGGAYKPRTSPYAFQGHREEGLAMLRRASEATGLLVVTEVIEPKDVDLVAQYADILQIGARNMQNYSLLKEAGRSGRPILLKRGLASTIEEWLMAAEYILTEGNPDVILCERGIRTYETATRNTLDLSAVPVLKSLTHLPVFVDPSHGTGKRHLVAPMAKAAIAAGADGLIVEVHINPAEALSDGPQSLEPSEFRRLMAQLRVLHEVVSKLEDQDNSLS